MLESDVRMAHEYYNKPVEDRCKTLSEESAMGPVRNQGRLGWCFGYSGADVLTHELKIGPQKQISALWMSSLFHGVAINEMESRT